VVRSYRYPNDNVKHFGIEHYRFGIVPLMEAMMSEMQHTPGPWQVKQARNGHTAVYPTGSQERVADIYCPLDVDGHHAANARLIAAAPELLAALKAMMLNHFEHHQDCSAARMSHLENFCECGIAAARAAIAKATGQ
jgi:hypothetical protein